jgi:hypothetical protein
VKEHTPIKESQLTEWAELVDAATPGPWDLINNSWEVTTGYSGEGSVFQTHCGSVDEDENPDTQHEKDAEFIVAARRIAS